MLAVTTRLTGTLDFLKTHIVRHMLHLMQMQPNIQVLIACLPGINFGVLVGAVTLIFTTKILTVLFGASMILDK